MGRVCFVLQVRADRLAEHRERHRAVWPEMLDALRDAGWRNYSLFLRDHGLLVGYLESDDFAAAQRAMASNYAGQDDLRARRARLQESLARVYEALPAEQELLLEYKPYEPAFYATDLADWGSALLACQSLGERAKVLVDLGHHLPCANVEQIVAILVDERRLGGFHFNNRRYGDDDLIVGSTNPWELFLILVELAEDAMPRLTIGQSHNVDRDALAAAEDPVAAFRSGDWQQRAIAQRGENVAVAGGWGR